MTARSEQRAREMAVIDAAVRFVTEYNLTEGLGLGSMVVARQRLIAVVGDYCEHGLAEATGTPTRYTAPATSHEAAQWLSDRVKKPLGRIMAAIISANGLTVDQLEQRLGLSHQTVSARTNQLRDQGYVIDSGERRLTRSNRQAIVWRASAMARAAAREVPEWGWPPMGPCEKEA